MINDEQKLQELRDKLANLKVAYDMSPWTSGKKYREAIAETRQEISEIEKRILENEH